MSYDTSIIFPERWLDIEAMANESNTSWIKVKRFADGSWGEDVSLAARLAALAEHHRKETEFLVSVVRRLARRLEDPGSDPDCVELGNMTSNVGSMYYAVMPGPYEGGGRYDGTGGVEPRGGLPGLSGLSCAVAGPIIEQALNDMIERKEELRKLEPSNGWGSYEGALDYLRKIRNACEANPSGVLAVNW